MNRYRFPKIFAAFERKILNIEDATTTCSSKHRKKLNTPIMDNYWYFLGIWLVHHWNFKMLYQYWYNVIYSKIGIILPITNIGIYLVHQYWEICFQYWSHLYNPTLVNTIPILVLFYNPILGNLLPILVSSIQSNIGNHNSNIGII